MRGLSLYRDRGDEIVVYPTTGEYGVPSASKEGVIYHVSVETEHCECDSYRFSGRACKHVFCAMLFAVQRRAGGAARVHSGLGRRCGRSAA